MAFQNINPDVPLPTQAPTPSVDTISARASDLAIPIPSGTWRMLGKARLRKRLPKGLDAAWDAAVGKLVPLVPRQSRYLKRAAKVLAMEREFAELSDARLREAGRDIRAIFRLGRETPADVERALAFVREAAFRQLGMKPYQVQVAAALTIFDGCIAEMATGEGKSLMATLPAVLHGWKGKGCHVVTVNDYLAKRDAEEFKDLYNFCGVSVSWVEGGMFPPDRRAAYLADVTYCTNKEAAADFLRDSLALGRMQGLVPALLHKIDTGSGGGTDRLVMRGLDVAIIDEADSVMIDEGVTPLIISGDSPNAEQVEAYIEAADVARQMTINVDYKVNHQYREVELTNAGKEKAADLTVNYSGLWAGTRRREELVTQALTARELFLFGKQYVIQEGKVVIVDESTGRLMPDRTWRDGLHQAVEAKEKLEVNPPKQTMARLSFQRFFRLYERLSGMTGTAAEARQEFWTLYHLPLVVIPHNRPCIRKHLHEHIYATADAKWRAIVERIKEIHAIGRPILVGTRSVKASQTLSEMLELADLTHVVLNALNAAEEAQIVAGAGQPGRITVATNMAGRGTDIKLGRGVAEMGGLHVLSAERNDSGRVDRQLYGRAGRQGDPGTAETFSSLEDEIILRYAKTLGAALRARYGHTEREITSAAIKRVFDMAQRKSERLGLRQRKSVLKTDDWLDEFLGFAGQDK